MKKLMMILFSASLISSYAFILPSFTQVSGKKKPSEGAYNAKPIPADQKHSDESPFSMRKHQFYRALLEGELERTGATNLKLWAYVDGYCNEMYRQGSVTYDDGTYPAVNRDTIRAMCKEAEQLIDSGLSHPVLYYCYYTVFIRSGYDLFTYRFGDRKRIAKAGYEDCQSDPKTHPLFVYTFCNEMRMRAQGEDQQKWIDEMHELLPRIFYLEFMGSELDDVTADLFHQLLRWAQPPEDLRIDADNLMNDPKVSPWMGLYADGRAHRHEAWKWRGGGFADTVTKEGWEGFLKHSEQARESWTKAWELRPDLPEAPRQMIGVGMATPVEPNEARKWLDRTLAAQFDYRGAYDDYVWAIMERWGGSIQEIVAFSQECVDTGRYDSCVPFQVANMISWMTFDQDYPDRCLAKDEFIPMFEQMFEGYRTAENLTGENRNAVLSYIAALAVYAGDCELGHRVLEEIGYRFDRRYFQKAVGLNSEDYVWMAWCNGGPAANVITQARQYAADNQSQEAVALYDQVLALPDAPPKATDRILMEKELVHFRPDFDNGQWVDVYSGNTPPEWLETNSYWSRDEDGGLKCDTGRPVGWLPVELSLIEGFELELDVGERGLSKQYDTHIYLCNPGWHDFHKPYIKVTSSKKKLTVMVGRKIKAGRNGLDEIQQTVDFEATGNDRVRIVVKHGKIDVKVNDEVVLAGISIPWRERYEDKIGLAFGNHNLGQNNAQNRYNNIRVKKGTEVERNPSEAPEKGVRLK